MARPTGEKVEIEFTPGVWTDVTADVRGSRVSVKYGRTSEFSDPVIAEMSLELDDLSGNYTVRNVSSPYYPNVQPRKRIRWSITAGPLFTGYIKGWPPRFYGRQRYVPITAVDRMELLGRVDLLGIGKTAARALSPTVLIPFDDESGSTTVGTDAGESLRLVYLGGASGGDVTFGSTVPGADWMGPVASFKGKVTSLIASGGYVARVPSRYWTSSSAWSMALTFRWDQSVPCDLQELFGSRFEAFGYPALRLELHIAGLVFDTPYGAVGYSGGLRDGNVHSVVVTYDSTNLRMYVDGVLSSTFATGAIPYANSELYVGGSTADGATNAFAQLALFGWWDGVTLSAGQVTAYDSGARVGFAGETSGARFSRILTYAGLNPATEANVMTGGAVMGAADLVGKTVADALKDIAITEGGGAVAYVQPDGKVAFIDRTYRNPGTPVMTIDAEADLDGDSFQPEYDEATVVNDVTATRTGGIPQRAVDAASVAALGTTTDSFDVQTSTDVAALGLAQDRVARFAWPALRIPRLAVDLMTATTSGLYTALASLVIGSRVRLTGVTTTRSGAVVFPVSQIDEYVEGWEITSTADSFDLSMDVTAADAPAPGMWDDTTYGRWQADPGSMTLQSSIAAGATSLAVVTSGSSPTFSTTGGDYPLQIRIDEEVLTVSSAPAGSSSPQTLTVTRGQAGTIAAAHAAGAQITLYPLSTWTL